MANADTIKAYKPLDVVQIPESIPGTGIEAGDIGVVDSVYNGGKCCSSRFPDLTIPLLSSWTLRSNLTVL